MDHAVAIKLIQSETISKAGKWADLGAGEGTFTRALAEIIGPKGEIYAMDKEYFAPMSGNIHPAFAKIHRVQSDFSKKLDLPLLDGLLMANSLHYIDTPIPFLNKILPFLKLGGQFILVEYDRKTPNPWVPYPIPQKEWKKIATNVGLSPPKLLGQQNSRYGNGVIYAVISEFIRM